VTTYLTIRRNRLAGTDGRFGGGLAGSFALHAVAATLLLTWAYVSHAGQSWGQAAATAGAIQATMVSDIPLPPKAPMDENNVLATDNPSPAPVTPAPKTVDVPQPDAIPIPVKPTKPAKLADKATPAPPLHPQPIQIQPNKVQAGEGAGVRIAMSSIQTRAGTASVDVSDTAFGAKFAYYVQEIDQKVASQWYTTMLDPQAAGHRLYVNFEIERDGSVTHIQIAQPSGDTSLDRTGLSAVQHVDNFPPLPEAYNGTHIGVTFYFDPAQHP
jgi:protein TonB